MIPIKTTGNVNFASKLARVELAEMKLRKFSASSETECVNLIFATFRFTWLRNSAQAREFTKLDTPSWRKKLSNLFAIYDRIR